ncbi:MAG: rod shape-determining protein [Nitrosopumilus sp.]|nr:rod shape-determining protein [Nitrosopumilus sp.]
MAIIGLDMGTSFVKCVFDGGRFTFPAIYAYTNRQKWDDDKTLLMGVGEEALKVAAYPNSVVIRPIIEGRPVHKKGVEELVKETKRRMDVMSDSKEKDRVKTIVVGLPYDADNYKETLYDILKNTLNPENCVIVPQVIGTLESIGRKSATVMNIGQGTTEIVAFENMKTISGQSVMHGCDFLTRDLGEFAFLDLTVYAQYKDEIAPRIDMLADMLVNRLETFMAELKPMYECSKTVVLSGGGILIPELKAAILKRMNVKVEVPNDPVMSNANGLYKIAARHGIL